MVHSYFLYTERCIQNTSLGINNVVRNPLIFNNVVRAGP